MKALEESHLLPIILSTLYNMIVTPYNHQDEDKLLIACKVFKFKFKYLNVLFNLMFLEILVRKRI